MRKLVGLAVVVFLVWFFFIRPGSSEFGCESAAAVAHAGSDECPSSIEAAADDAGWAADRITSIQDERLTTGVLYVEGGDSETITSGESGSAFDSAMSYLEEYASLLRGQPRGKQVAGHVETKAAAVLRDDEQSLGVLVINNPEGPCRFASGVGCRTAPKLILPKGSALVVWWPDSGPLTLEGQAEP